MRKNLWFLLLLMGSVACGGGQTAVSENTPESTLTAQDMTANALSTAIVASAEPPYDPTALTAELEAATARWNSQQVQRYQLTVSHRQGTWDTQNITLTVENGQITDSQHTCFPQKNCVLQPVEPETVTIEALFETAVAVIALNDPETQITFSQTYGYPNGVIYTDASWVVNGFEVLEDE